MAMIIPKLQLFEVERKPLGRDPMVFHQALLSVAPEPFQAIDVDPSTGETCAVIDLEVAVAAEDEGIVDLEPIGVDDAPTTHLRDGQAQHRLGLNVGQDLQQDPTVSFQDPEDGNLAGGSPSTPPLASPPEVGFVHLHLSSQECCSSVLGVSHDGQTQGRDGLVRGVVSDFELSGHLARGDFELKELEQTEPLWSGERAAIDPASAEIVEGVMATSAASAAVGQAVESSTLTPGTRSLMVFPAKSQQESSGGGLAANQLLISLQVHNTILQSVPDREQSPIKYWVGDGGSAEGGSGRSF